MGHGDPQQPPCFRARFRLPQVKEGYPCAYVTSFDGRVCGKPLDTGEWRAHDCARVPINERHNGVGEEIKGMAREATLRANTEQRAVERPVEEPAEGESRPPRRPTGRADIRIHAEGGRPVT